MITPAAQHPVSPCCGVPVYVVGRGETHWYECQRCHAPVDPITREEYERITANDDPLKAMARANDC